MPISGEASNRRVRNASALAASGASAHCDKAGSTYRVIREGSGSLTIFTIGYERRDGEDLMAALRDAGVAHLADIRDKPMSRKPDFRARALAAMCQDAGIEYGSWPDLGSTERQREGLRESGDLKHFHRLFRSYAERSLGDALDRLASVAKKKPVALLCYERVHEECHRSTVADLVAKRLDACITAIA